ncbi:MAG TPA: glycosyl hydrolase family 18 protein [Puia sp.]|nr:glycosyl hydrolase family 18 protein [Puia sp.]
MRQTKLLRSFAVFILLSASAHLHAQKQKKQAPERKLHLWYIADSSSHFSQLFPVRTLVSSLSVFGTLPKTFIDSCRMYHIQLYLAVSDGENAINSDAKTDSTVKKYVIRCLKGGYDGIDLDYEGLAPDAQRFYLAFLRKLSAALHGHGKKLSHCVGYYPAMIDKGPEGFFYTPTVVNETCDLVRVMCYDMYFAPGKNVDKLMGRPDCQGIGPTSNYPWTLEAMSFWSKYVRPEKLVMCLPAYSNDYVFGPKVTGDQVYAACPNDKSSKITDSTWLWYERLNLYNYVDSLNRTHIFYASDAKSTQSLLAITKKLALQNIGFWHFSSINDATWQVISEWLKTGN